MSLYRINRGNVNLNYFEYWDNGNLKEHGIRWCGEIFFSNMNIMKVNVNFLFYKKV